MTEDEKKESVDPRVERVSASVAVAKAHSTGEAIFDALAPPSPPEAVEAPPPAPAVPTEPPNKLHEYGAAAVIMVFLTLVLWMFLTFLRGASL